MKPIVLLLLVLLCFESTNASLDDCFFMDGCAECNAQPYYFSKNVGDSCPYGSVEYTSTQCKGYCDYDSSRGSCEDYSSERPYGWTPESHLASCPGYKAIGPLVALIIGGIACAIIYIARLSQCLSGAMGRTASRKFGAALNNFDHMSSSEKTIISHYAAESIVWADHGFGSRGGRKKRTCPEYLFEILGAVFFLIPLIVYNATKGSASDLLILDIMFGFFFGFGNLCVFITSIVFKLGPMCACCNHDKTEKPALYLYILTPTKAVTIEAMSPSAASGEEGCCCGCDCSTELVPTNHKEYPLPSLAQGIQTGAIRVSSEGNFPGQSNIMFVNDPSCNRLNGFVSIQQAQEVMQLLAKYATGAPPPMQQPPMAPQVIMAPPVQQQPPQQLVYQPPSLPQAQLVSSQPPMPQQVMMASAPPPGAVYYNVPPPSQMGAPMMQVMQPQQQFVGAAPPGGPQQYAYYPPQQGGYPAPMMQQQQMGPPPPAFNAPPPAAPPPPYTPS